ncbi:MAG: hypothetical protein IKB31_11100 [Bacteroidaceae bacterium]|nr:hypothetical protein [Bacteroidaceae bacterium]
MKKFLFLVGLVMAAALFVSCTGDTTTVKINGKNVRVSKITAEKFTLDDIERALDRESVVKNLKRPKNASDFGKKKYEIEWKALDRQLNQHGTVLVIHYEKGIEVNKDGKAWFYDFDKFKCVEPEYIDFIAVESVMHPGVWEPASVEIDIMKDLTFSYGYTGKGSEGRFEVFFMPKQVYEAKGITSVKDLIVNKKVF